MTVGRLLAIVGITALAGLAAYLTWPRPDTEIRVARGGVATVFDGLGRSRPLGDTVRIGGSGPRRKLRIVNEDSVSHQLAMFTVQSGQRTDYDVPMGSFGGFCSAHPGTRQLTFVIQ